MDPSKMLWRLLLPTTVVDAASADIPELDTFIEGVLWREVDYIVFLGATDAALTALKIQDGAVSGVLADVADGAFGGAGEPALPGATDDGKPYRITRRFGNRYQKIVATVADGAVGASLTVFAVLRNPSMLNLDDHLPTARNMVNQEITV